MLGNDFLPRHDKFGRIEETFQARSLETFQSEALFNVKSSVTRLGDLLHFGQLFKDCGNNYYAQMANIYRKFL